MWPFKAGALSAQSVSTDGLTVFHSFLTYSHFHSLLFRSSVLEKHLQRAELAIQSLRTDHDNDVPWCGPRGGRPCWTGHREWR